MHEFALFFGLIWTRLNEASFKLLNIMDDYLSQKTDEANVIIMSWFEFLSASPRSL